LILRERIFEAMNWSLHETLQAGEEKPGKETTWSPRNAMYLR
jgi:hypothetical protein